jgi:hypothetical protein
VLGQSDLQIGLADQSGLDETFADFLAQKSTSWVGLVRAVGSPTS